MASVGPIYFRTLTGLKRNGTRSLLRLLSDDTYAPGNQDGAVEIETSPGRLSFTFVREAPASRAVYLPDGRWDRTEFMSFDRLDVVYLETQGAMVCIGPARALPPLISYLGRISGQSLVIDDPAVGAVELLCRMQSRGIPTVVEKMRMEAYEAEGAWVGTYVAEPLAQEAAQRVMRERPDTISAARIRVELPAEAPAVISIGRRGIGRLVTREPALRAYLDSLVELVVGEGHDAGR